MFSDDMSYTSSLGHLFWVMTKEHPELITGPQIDRIFTALKEHKGIPQELHLIFQGLGCVVNVQPRLFHKHRDTLLYFTIEQKNTSAYTCLQQYFLASTIVGEQQANEALEFFIDLLKKSAGIINDIRSQIFYACQTIGLINTKALQNKRTELEAFKSYPECRTLLDFIDGNKMSEENQAAINRTREEITQMQKRVVKTEKDVTNITKVVQRQELKVSSLPISNCVQKEKS